MARFITDILGSIFFTFRLSGRHMNPGMRTKILQKILGHADIQTTLNTYCDVFEKYEKTQVIKRLST